MTAGGYQMQDVTEISEEFLNELKRSLRVTTEKADTEVKDLVEAAVQDMYITGVISKGETDPLSRQAIKLYCKGHYGYDENTERFIKSYESLRDSMALSGEYREESTDGS